MTSLPTRPHWLLTASAIGLAAVLGVARWAFGTGDEAGFPYGMFILAGFWVYIEAVIATDGTEGPEVIAIHRWHRVVFAAIAVYAAGVSGLALAADLDFLGVDTLRGARRVMGFAGGVMLAVWGNFLPKLLSPWRARDEPFDWQGVHRVVGWLASLGGVAMALVWLGLPLDEAASASKVLFRTVFLLAVLLKLHSLMAHPREQGGVRP